MLYITLSILIVNFCIAKYSQKYYLAMFIQRQIDNCSGSIFVELFSRFTSLPFYMSHLERLKFQFVHCFVDI